MQPRYKQQYLSQKRTSFSALAKEERQQAILDSISIKPYDLPKIEAVWNTEFYSPKYQKSKVFNPRVQIKGVRSTKLSNKVQRKKLTTAPRRSESCKGSFTEDPRSQQGQIENSNVVHESRIKQMQRKLRTVDFNPILSSSCDDRMSTAPTSSFMASRTEIIELFTPRNMTALSTRNFMFDEISYNTTPKGSPSRRLAHSPKNVHRILTQMRKYSPKTQWRY